MSPTRRQDGPSLDLEGLRRRRAEAVDSWFETYADAVYTFVLYRVGKDADLAADVAQETFLNALERIREFDPERGEMLPWLTYQARNCIRKALRGRARQETVADFWETFDRRLVKALSELGAAPLPDELLEKEETADLVRMALSNLPARYRTALHEHYFEERSVHEMAAREGTTEGAVKALLHRARLAFRAAFEAIAAALHEGADAGRVLS